MKGVEIETGGEYTITKCILCKHRIMIRLKRDTQPKREQDGMKGFSLSVTKTNLGS